MSELYNMEAWRADFMISLQIYEAIRYKILGIASTALENISKYAYASDPAIGWTRIIISCAVKIVGHQAPVIYI